MKSKELLEAIENNDITVLEKLTVLNNVVVKEVINYYDGICSALAEVNNSTYMTTWANFDEHDSMFSPRRYVVLDTVDNNYDSFEELFNRNIEVIGYYYET